MYLPGGFEVRPPEVPAESCPHCGLCLLHSPASSRGATSSRPHLCTDPCLPRAPNDEPRSPRGSTPMTAIALTLQRSR